MSGVKACVPKLNIVSLNAGVTEWKYVKSPDEYKMTLQINVLSTALMAIPLLPKLRETATVTYKDDDFPPHMSFLLSIAAWEVEADWLPLGQSLPQWCDVESKWATIKQYFLVKLALWYFIQGLVEREEKEGKRVIINANCPGLCKTSMSGNFPLIIRLITLLQYFFVGRTAEEGARTMVGATCPGREYGKPVEK